MNKARLERYRSTLNGQLSVLLDHNDDTVVTMEVEDEAFPDPNDRATHESDRSFDLRLRDRDRKLITKIREALQRIDEGTFGVCEDCGLPIEEKRLSARPVTSQCIECKEDQERRERRERIITGLASIRAPAVRPSAAAIARAAPSTARARRGGAAPARRR